MCRHWQETATHKPRGEARSRSLPKSSEGADSADTLVSGFQSLELRDDQFPVFNCQWYFVTAALGNAPSLHTPILTATLPLFSPGFSAFNTKTRSSSGSAA